MANIGDEWRKKLSEEEKEVLARDKMLNAAKAKEIIDALPKVIRKGIGRGEERICVYGPILYYDVKNGDIVEYVQKNGVGNRLSRRGLAGVAAIVCRWCVANGLFCYLQFDQDLSSGNERKYCIEVSPS